MILGVGLSSLIGNSLVFLKGKTQHDLKKSLKTIVKCFFNRASVLLV